MGSRKRALGRGLTGPELHFKGFLATTIWRIQCREQSDQEEAAAVTRAVCHFNVLGLTRSQGGEQRLGSGYITRARLTRFADIITVGNM